MKHIIFSFTLLVSCLLHYCTVNAQISIGIKGGYINAWPDYGDVSLPENAETDIHGFNFALLGYKQLSKNFSLGVEPGGVRRGAACLPGWGDSFIGDSKLFLGYAEFPVMAQWEEVYFKKLYVRAKAGLGISYLISAYEEEPGIFGGISRDKVNDKGARLNLLDYGLHAGMSLGFNLKQYRIFAESAYYHGFRDSANFETSKNRALNFSIGCMMNLPTS